MMSPVTQTDNPMLMAAQVAGVVLGLLLGAPSLYVFWRIAVFFAKAIAKLEAIDEIAADVRKINEARQSEERDSALSFAQIEIDVAELQRKAGISVTRYPDRRVGPADRRAS